jgi:hypothetical protein|tara:strand:+ start:1957 stop:2133 length:177 start_codon:yes stop_codon:yes gene_type:complete
MHCKSHVKEKSDMKKLSKLNIQGDKILARCWAKHDTGSIEYWQNRRQRNKKSSKTEFQ